MFRILVVDDEPIVVQSIFHIIETDIDRKITLEKARNGREAIETAWKFKPDIVITDIKMPGINGLCVINEIKTQLQNTRFIILSAYDHFAFAKEAVTLGVDEYLLKPVSRKRMAQVINNSLDKIEDRHAKLKSDLIMKEKIEKMLPSIESGFLLSMLFFDDINTKNGQDLLGINGEGGSIIIAELYSTLSHPGLTENTTFYDACLNILKQFAGCLVCQLSAWKIAAFIPVLDERLHKENTKTIARNLVNKNEFKDAFIAVGVGNIRRDLKALKESYVEAALALNCIKKDKSLGTVMHVDDIKKDLSTDLYLAEKKKIMYSKIVMGDSMGAIREFEDIFNWHKDACGDEFGKLKDRIAEIIIVTVVKVFDSGVPDNQETIAPILHAAGQAELLEICKAKIMELSVSSESFRQSKISELVCKANKLIEDGYANEITLEHISKELGITPSYFSRLYKQQTGYNFIDYLIKIRIENAKQLFKNTNLSVKEISYITGYIDPNYFSRLFKKVTGMTPTQYKGHSWDLNMVLKSNS